MRIFFILTILITLGINPLSANAPNFATQPLKDGGEETLQLLSASTDAKSAEIFSENCSNCHSGGVPRAPHSTTFQVMSPEYILSTLNGVMASQAEGLTQKEKIKLAEYITGGKVSDNLEEPIFCSANVKPIKLDKNNGYSQWGFDKKNSRNTKSNFTSENVNNIKLKWVFAYPSASRARSQPSISGNTIFVGGQNLFLYALDRETGCVRWRTKVDGEIRSAPAIYFGKNGESVLAGDYEGNLYKINPYTGAKIWTKSLRYHPRVILTGSVRVYDDIIYVPLSSREWADGADPEYKCCSFRGGVIALDYKTGEKIWKTYSIPVPPKATGKYNNMGIEILAPSGAPVWNSPTIDDKRDLIYFGTGEAYSSPAADTSDSIIAVNKTIGGIEWVFQAESGDAWNMGCFTNGAGCPEEDGPDWDFGASVILADIDKNNSILFAGRKSGHVYALDANNKGKIIWTKRIGKGGFAGGVHWGMATDNKSVFAAVADTNFINKFPGPATPGIYSLDGLTGNLNWKFTPQDRCIEKEKPACDIGISAAITATNDLVVGGGFDGWLYILNKNTGKLLWEYNTNIDFTEIAGIKAHGGSIESDGPVINGNNLLINSGYLYGGRLGGNVLLNFEITN
tara:strand:+ start:2274 stop:4148 length:1875 start_codon:yes stop_codon:yes gene_type:complete